MNAALYKMMLVPKRAYVGGNTTFIKGFLALVSFFITSVLVVLG